MSQALDNRVIGDWESRRLLLVEDEEALRAAVATYLTAHGFDVEMAESGEAALLKLQSSRYELMLCDVRMPGMSGLDLVPIARNLDPDLAIVMLTAMNDTPTASQAIERGAMEFLTKPIDFPDLTHALTRVLRRRQIAVDRKNVERLIAFEVERRMAKEEEVRAVFLANAVEALATAIELYESKDRFHPGTSRRVSALARAVGEELALPRRLVVQLEIAGRLHDIGKIALQDSVLNKPGALSAEEFAHVQEHVRLGVEILSPLSQLGDVIDAVRDHHEHWDGSGYPRGLAGEAISLGGRILCAADAFVALTSSRPSRTAMPIDSTIDYLEGHVGGLLDPAVFGALAKVIRNRRLVGVGSV
jgi:putative two-component system response regulator